MFSIQNRSIGVNSIIALIEIVSNRPALMPIRLQTRSRAIVAKYLSTKGGHTFFRY
jgi:hypothetical protein